MKAAVDELKKRGLTLCVCESCTGGLIGAEICSVPGASEVFAGGLITYTERTKEMLAGVDPETIRRYGVVSERTASEMAEGARRACGADLGLSVTGYAGPTGDEVGKVCFGISSGERTETVTKRFPGGRDEVRRSAAEFALKQLTVFLTKNY